MHAQLETATLGGGCFWCLEALYREVDGVVSVESGYAGGSEQDARYARVCEGDTGHAEVVRLQFEPARISYAEILELFFSIHDPTQLNRQGNDIGAQYRSVIFTHSEAQRQTAQAVIERMSQAGLFKNRIVTEIAPLNENYWPAEAYHQNYFARHPQHGYCVYVIAPKMTAFRQRFKNRLSS